MTFPRYRSVATATDTGGGNIIITKPTGTSDYAATPTCDWMVGVISCSPNQTITTVPAGWTEMETGKAAFRAWYKRPSAEGANYTWAATGGSGPRVTTGFIITYKDCDPTRPPTIGTVAEHIGSVSATAPSLTPAAYAAILLEIGTCTSATTDSVSAIAPPGMKERVDIQADTTSGTSVQVHLHCSEGYILPYAPTGDRVATLSLSKPNSAVLVVLYQVPLVAGSSTGDGIETLLEMTVWDEDLADETTKKYSGRGVTFTGNEFYEKRIHGSFEIAQRATDLIGAGGRIVTTVSEIELDNKDKSLDTIHEHMLAIDRTITIKTVAVTDEAPSDLGAGAVSSAVTVFVGVVSSMTPVGTKMRVTISDLSARLNVPLMAGKTYSGASGLGGGAELSGMTKPFSAGRLYNIQPQALGTIDYGSGARYTYQSHVDLGVGIQAHREVRERGLEMLPASPPGAGQYEDFPGSGTFQVGFTPNGVITCDLSGDSNASYVNQHGEIVERMLTGYGPAISAGDIDADSFDDIDRYLPGEIGVHFPAGSAITAFDAIERVLRSGAIWMSGGRNKKLRLALASPGPSDRLALTQADILSMRPVALPTALQPAPRHVDVKSGINWFPLTDISSSVSASQRRKLTSPGSTQRSTSTVVQTRQLPERTWTLPGLWRTAADAQARADQLRTWSESGLRACAVTTGRDRGVVGLGMGCEIESYPLYELDAGFSGIVTGWREVPALGRVTLMLIGKTGEDFVEITGTFVPTLGDGTNNYTLSVAQGTYSRIGSRVFWEATLIWTSIGSAGAGQLRMSGLPFAANNVGTPRYSAAISNFDGLDTTATLNQIFAFQIGNATQVLFSRATDNSTAASLAANSSSATGQIYISGTYRV